MKNKSTSLYARNKTVNQALAPVVSIILKLLSFALLCSQLIPVGYATTSKFSTSNTESLNSLFSYTGMLSNAATDDISDITRVYNTQSGKYKYVMFYVTFTSEVSGLTTGNLRAYNPLTSTPVITPLITDVKKDLSNKKRWKVTVKTNANSQVNLELNNLTGTGYTTIKTLPYRNNASYYSITSSSSGLSKLYTWGYNLSGGLGIGSTNEYVVQNRPVLLPSQSAYGWQDITGGSGTFLAIRDDNTLWGWGINNDGQLGIGNTAKQISPVQCAPAYTWSAITTGMGNSIGITTGGNLMTWGNNAYGSLGIGNTTSMSTPQIPTGTGSYKWKSIACTNRSNFAIRQDGTLWAWGDNTSGSLGLEPAKTDSYYTTPQQIGSDNNWERLCVQGSFAFKTDGSLWGWGKNSIGQLGNGSTSYDATTPFLIPGSWKSMSINSSTSNGTTSNGKRYAAGSNYYGDFGSGSNSPSYNASRAQIGNDTDWEYAFSSCNYQSYFATKQDGSLWAWGSNGNSTLGIGNSTDTYLPVKVSLPANLAWEDVGGNTFSSAGLAHPIPTTSVSSISSNNSNAAYAASGNTITIFFTASGSVTTPDVTIAGGGATVTSVSGNTSWKAVYTLDGSEAQGALTYSIAYVDAEGNPGTSPGTYSSITVDSYAPSMALSNMSSNATNNMYARTGSIVTLNFTSSESLGALPQVTIRGRTATVSLVSGNTYKAVVTMLASDAEGLIPYTVNMADAAGNTASLSATSSVTYDKTPPFISSIVRQSPAAVSTNASEITYRVTFSEMVIGVDATDFTANVLSGSITTGSSSWTSVSGSVYDIRVPVTGSGTIRLDLKSSGTGIYDFADNFTTGAYTSGQSYTIDQSSPVVTGITRRTPANQNINTSSLTYRVTFSEDVTGVDASDFTAATVSGTVSAGSVSLNPVSPGIYDVTLTGVSGSGELRLNLNSSGTGIVDLTGNAISGGYTSGETYITDSTPPTVSQFIRKTPSSQITNVTSVVYELTFHEAVTGVSTDDFTVNVTSGTLNTGALQLTAVSGSVYQITVPAIAGNGTFRLVLNAASTGIADLAGNAIAGGYNSGELYTIDQVVPAVNSLIRKSPLGLNTNASSVTFRISFSEAVSGVDGNDFTLIKTGTLNSGALIVSRISDDVYDITVPSISGDGDLKLNLNNTATGITDAAGNSCSGYPGTENYIIDQTSPAVTAITRQTPSGSLTNASQVIYKINFSEDVTGADASDFEMEVLSGTVSAGSVTWSALSAHEYLLSLNSLSGNGQLKLNLKAAGTGITDHVNNPLTAGFTAGQLYLIDQTAPSVNNDNAGSSNSNTAMAKTGDMITLNFTSTELINTPYVTIAGLPALVSDKSNNNWEAKYTLTGSEAEGLIPYHIDLSDLAGNTASHTANSSITYDRSLPQNPVIQLVSGLNAAGYTQNVRPVLSGTAEANSTISILLNGSREAQQVSTGPDGRWSFNLDHDLTDGSYSIETESADAAGNSSTSTVLTIIVDTNRPAVPPSPAVPSNGYTNDNTPTYNGTTEPGAAVVVVIDGVSYGPVTADTDGKWEININPALTDATHTLKVVITDIAGNSSESNAVTVIVDTAQPATPAVPSIPANGYTNDNTPAFNGITEPGASVVVIIDGVSYGTVAADTDGKWEITISPALSDAAHEIKIRVTDPAGNSSESAAVNLTVDTAQPVIPPAPTVPANGLINDNTPTFNGTTEPGASVVVVIDGVSYGPVTADTDGKWEISISPALTDADHGIKIRVTDPAGNSSESAAVNITVDTAHPATPAAPSIPANGYTNDNTPRFSGTTEPGASVVVVVDDISYGPVTADTDGKWEITVNPALSDAAYEIKIRVTDQAGNSSESAAVTLIVDTAQPLTPATPSVPANGYTNDNTPMFSGTTEPGASVIVIVDGVNYGPVTADTDGKWEITIHPALTDADHEIKIRVTDPAGNSSESAAVTITVDTSQPATPAAPSIPANGYINDNTPMFSGTTEPGASVVVVIDGVSYGPVTAGSDGKWGITINPALPDGPHEIKIIVTDPAGNSSESAAVTVSIDTVQPSTPAAPSIPANGYSNNNTPVFSGTTEPGASVVVIIDGISYGPVTAGSDGKWEITINPALPDGPHEIKIIVTDPAGNSTESTPVTLIIDTGKPAVPAPISTPDNGQINDNTPTYGGVTEPGASVVVMIDGNGYGPVIAGPDGKWEITINPALTDGPHEIKIIVTDTAGNSTESIPVTVIIDATSPSVPASPEIPANGQSNDNTPAFNGTTEPGASVVVIVDGVSYGPVTAGPDGKWEITINPALPDGPHNIKIVVTDPAGNSTESPSVTLVTDTGKPFTPAPPAVPASGRSNDNTPTYGGITEPGATVVVVIDGTSYGPVTAGPDGKWEITINPALPDGPHDIKIVITDPAGNSSESAIVTVVIDTDRPATPASPLIPASGSTNNNTPTYNGTTEPGATVVVVIDGISYGPVTAGPDGHWEITISPALNDGPHEVKIIVTDTAGNSSESSTVALVVDTVQPSAAAPDIPANGQTNDNTPTFGGITEPGATVVVIIDGISYGPVTAGPDGHWEITINPALSDGPHEVKIVITDHAGNSTESNTVRLVVDTEKPAEPARPTVTGGTTDGNGTVTTTTGTPTIGGTAEPGATVEIRVDGEKIGEVTVGADGKWEYTFPSPLGDGSHQIVIVVKDPAGNESGPGGHLEMIVVTSKVNTQILLDLQEKTYGDADFQAGAVSTSPAPLLYSSSNSNAASVDASGNIHITGAGTTVISVSQSAIPGFTAGESRATLTINKASQQINHSLIPQMERYGQAYQLIVSSGSGLPVHVASSNPFVVKTEGTLLKPQGIGTARILLSQDGDQNYLPVTTEAEVKVVDPSGEKIIVSKLITPNGDGINDMLTIEGLSNFSEYRFILINRNGVRVFDSSTYPTGDIADQADKRGFSGTTYRTGYLSEGSYFYTLKYKDDGIMKHKTGYIVIKY